MGKCDIFVTFSAYDDVCCVSCGVITLWVTGDVSTPSRALMVCLAVLIGNCSQFAVINV